MTIIMTVPLLISKNVNVKTVFTKNVVIYVLENTSTERGILESCKKSKTTTVHENRRIL